MTSGSTLREVAMRSYANGAAGAHLRFFDVALGVAQIFNLP